MLTCLDVSHQHLAHTGISEIRSLFRAFTPPTQSFQKTIAQRSTDIQGTYHSKMRDGTAPPEFTCFAHLPFDVRACIWEAVAFLPRNIDLWAQHLGTTTATSSSQPTDGFSLFRYVTTQPPPAILHVNQESRAIGLKHYSLEFGSSYEIPRHYGLRAESPPKTYINFHSDRVCLVGAFDLHSFPWVFDPRPTAQLDRRVIQFPMSVAINVVTACLTFLQDEDQFIAACSPYEEVLLYYLEDEDAVHLPGPGKRALIEFIPVDISTKGNRGLCFELHTRLQALRASSESSGIVNSRLARLGLGEVSGIDSKRLCPNVQWVTLVVNGRKLGL